MARQFRLVPRLSADINRVPSVILEGFRSGQWNSYEWEMRNILWVHLCVCGAERQTLTHSAVCTVVKWDLSGTVSNFMSI